MFSRLRVVVTELSLRVRRLHALVGGLAITEVTFRTLGDTEFVIALFSILSGLTVSMLGWATEWLLFAVLVYSVVPTIFPSTPNDVPKRFGLRAIVVFLVIAISMSGTSSSGPRLVENTFSNIDIMGPVILITILSLWLYLSSVEGREIGTMSGLLPSIGLSVLRFDRDKVTELKGKLDEMKRRDSDGGFATSPWSMFFILFGTLFFVVICSLGGIIVIFLSMLYPLTEIGVIAGVLIRSTGDERFRMINKDTVVPSMMVDEQFLTMLKNAIRGTKGLICSAMIAFSCLIIFLTAGIGSLLAVFLVRLSLFPEQVALPTNLATLPAYVYLTLVSVLLLCSGLYGIWFWYRMIRRLPFFLDIWYETRTKTPLNDPIRPDGDLRIPSRPPASTIPFVIGLVMLVVLLSFVDASTGPNWSYVGITSGSLFLVLLTGWWSVSRARAMEPQPVESDNHALFVAYVIQFGGLLVIFHPGTGATVAPAGGFPFQMTANILIGGLFVYSPDLLKLLELTDWREFSFTVIIHVVTGVVVASNFVFSGIQIISDMGLLLILVVPLVGIFHLWTFAHTFRYNLGRARYFGIALLTGYVFAAVMAVHLFLNWSGFPTYGVPVGVVGGLGATVGLTYLYFRPLWQTPG